MSELADKAGEWLAGFMLPGRVSPITAMPRVDVPSVRELVSFGAIRGAFPDRSVTEIIEALDEAGASVWVRP